MHILIVDDKPKFRVQPTIYFLKEKNVDFTYKIVNSVNSALQYIDEHLNEIDLAIIDLGLPHFDNDRKYSELNGLLVIEHLLEKTIDIPIIINSEKRVVKEKSCLKPYIKQGAVIQHLNFLSGEWLIEFLKKI